MEPRSFKATSYLLSINNTPSFNYADQKLFTRMPKMLKHISLDLATFYVKTLYQPVDLAIFPIAFYLIICHIQS